MKTATYGMGLLASLMFAVAIAQAQTSGGAGATGSSGTSASGSSGVGASSPSNLGTAGTSTGTTTGGTGAATADATAGTTQLGQPGQTTTQQGLQGRQSTAAGAQQQSGLNQQFDANRQSDFSQRTAAEQQRLIDQQRSDTLRTQQGQLNQRQSQFSDQRMLDDRGALGEQQIYGRQDAMRDDAMLRDQQGRPSDRGLAAGREPGELGVFIVEGQGPGVEINRVVEGSAADEAGLQPGDVILQVEGQGVEATPEVTQLIRSIPAGETAMLSVWRDGQEYQVEATLQPSARQPYAVGYRGDAAAGSEDLAARTRRLEEQLDMVVNELQRLRQEVVALRGGPGGPATGIDARFRDDEIRTGMETDFDQQRTMRDEIRTPFDQRETRQGIDTQFNQQDTRSGIDTQIDQRRAQPGLPNPDANRPDGADATQPAQPDDDLFGPTQTGTDRDATQSLNDQDATQQTDQSATEEQTETEPALPF